MKKENNFKKALNELLNLDGSDSDEVSEIQGGDDISSEQPAEENTAQTDTSSDTSPQEESVLEESPSSSEPPVLYEGTPDIPDSYPAIEKPVYEAVITPDVIINGNIIAGSNLKILGKVFGNVECEGTIVLSGRIDGDVSANKLRFMSGGIQGNVSVKEDIAAEKGTHVKGDVNARSAVFSGDMQGELVVHENLELRATSSILGNIKARGIAIHNGSKVKGMLDIGGGLEEVRADNEE